MRISSALVPLVLLLPLFACEEQRQEGVESSEAVAEEPEVIGRVLNSDSGAFTVELPLPERPVYRKLPITTGYGITTMHQHAQSDAERSFTAAWADYPDSLFAAGARPEAILSAGRDGWAQTLNGMIESEDDSVYHGYPMKVFTVSGDQGGSPLFSRTHAYLIGKRLYVLSAMALEPAELKSPATEDFFESFRVTDFPRRSDTTALIESPDDSTATGQPR